MAKLAIDGKPVEIEEGATILAAAEKAGVTIPTLCYNEELSPAGACRLCVVEVTQDGALFLATACTHPVAEGMSVSTASEKALAARRLAIELLMAQKPHSTKLEKLASDMGLEKSRFALPQKECILCRMCVRTCQEVVGASAIAFMAQGLDRENKEAGVVFLPEKCIACGSCAYICPTLAVTMEDNQSMRTIKAPNIKMEFRLKACARCGGYYAPEKQLEFMAQRYGLPLEKFDLCPDCRE